MIKTILFDYAGVLTPVNNNFDFAKKHSKRFGLPAEEIMKITYENWSETALGKLECGIFWGEIAKKLNINPNELRSLVIDTFPLDRRMIEIVKKAKKTHTTVLFSNQIKDWIEQVLNENNINNIFDHIINSYNVGARKPDKKIFFEAISRTGSRPEEILFIDDSLENIEAAKEIGINTIQFKNYPEFLSQYKMFVEGE